ncbi:carbohydrate kinase family protein [Rhodophyticola sp. CCM32]|uniref:carbohydrate kinase family protein n=1 Tax=Rhodophyticola sp. CCM32 TaxID=2916397 RepID=UPI00107F545A|nr:carbohydrate kinase family protein [Rhodophyticola sp. CCM32]QBY00813.1 carbohydrate kinase family protein [Rhodophyticola sp. CCM32]
MTHLVVTGYASLDYVLQLKGQIAGDRTTLCKRTPYAWPRAGGCPTYIATQATLMGARVTPVMWLGNDAAGSSLLNCLTDSGIDTDGVSTIAGAKSPSAVMAYQADGSCACLYDPGPAGAEQLTDPQRRAISLASHLCITVGPPHLLEEILALRPAGARLYWAVKNDPACFTPRIIARLQDSADVIFCSKAERSMITGTGATILQTLGPGGVTIEQDGTTQTLPVTPVAIRDNTGAGDCFAGGYIAAEMTGITDATYAAGQGIAAVSHMLTKRRRETNS